MIKGTVTIELSADIEIFDDGINDYCDQLYAQALVQFGVDEEYISRSSVTMTTPEDQQ